MELTAVYERLEEIRLQRIYGDDGMWELPDDLYNEAYDLYDMIRGNTCFIDEDTFNLDSICYIHD